MEKTRAWVGGSGGGEPAQNQLLIQPQKVYSTSARPVRSLLVGGEKWWEDREPPELVRGG